MEAAMLTYQDCLDYCDLTEDEIHAIADHEHLTELAALELGQYLVETSKGEKAIRKIILDDIANARAKGDLNATLKLRLVLRHFVQSHPNVSG